MARLFLDAGQTYGFVSDLDPSLTIIGTNSFETVYLRAQATATFDPSFNRGGDELIIDGNVADYSGARSGSNFILSDDQGTLVQIPAGPTGATITFNDDVRILQLDATGLHLDDQVFAAGAEPEQLDAAAAAMASAFEVQAPASDVAALEVETPSTLLFLAPTTADSSQGAFG